MTVMKFHGLRNPRLRFTVSGMSPGIVNGPFRKLQLLAFELLRKREHPRFRSPGDWWRFPKRLLAGLSEGHSGKECQARERLLNPSHYFCCTKQTRGPGTVFPMR
jgi:hypothetical protein